MTGHNWVDLLDSLGFKDIYDEYGLPDIGKPNGQRPSKREYLWRRLSCINGQDKMKTFFIRLLGSYPEIIDNINQNIRYDGYQVIQDSDGIHISGRAPEIQVRPIRNLAFFENIEAQIINDLDKARVSIYVAIAWFTNQKIADKLIQKYNEGLEVKVLAYLDGVNSRFGVNLGGIPYKEIRGTRGGIMHNKFCVIDNQRVITGSYNWSDNAENRNDENVSIMYDDERASDYSVEFRRLFTEDR